MRALWTRAHVWLAVVGVFPLTLARQGLWARVKLALGGPGPNLGGPTIQLPMSGSDGFLIYLITHGLGGKQVLIQGAALLWFVLAPAGIFLALALARLRVRRVALVLYVTWLIAITAISAIAAFQLFSAPQLVVCGEPGPCDVPAVVSRQPGWGAWVTLVALALLWIAVGARVFTPRAAITPSDGQWMPKSADDSPHLVAVRRIGAIAFTAGALIWGFGLILTPWAIQNCSGFPISWTHFVHGACAGLDAYNALSIAMPSTALALIEVIGLLGAIAVTAIWRRGWGGPVMAAIWTALALWLFFEALSCLGSLLNNPPELTPALSGAWAPGAGSVVTGIGLALFCGSLVWIWLGAAGLIVRNEPTNVG